MSAGYISGLTVIFYKYNEIVQELYEDLMNIITTLFRTDPASEVELAYVSLWLHDIEKLKDAYHRETSVVSPPWVPELPDGFERFNIGRFVAQTGVEHAMGHRSHMGFNALVHRLVQTCAQEDDLSLETISIGYVRNLLRAPYDETSAFRFMYYVDVSEPDDIAAFIIYWVGQTSNPRYAAMAAYIDLFCVAKPHRKLGMSKMMFSRVQQDLLQTEQERVNSGFPPSPGDGFFALEPADDKLIPYYAQYGFEFIEEMSNRKMKQRPESFSYTDIGFVRPYPWASDNEVDCSRIRFDQKHLMHLPPANELYMETPAKVFSENWRLRKIVDIDEEYPN
jgi:hypothetical protein